MPTIMPDDVSGSSEHNTWQEELSGERVRLPPERLTFAPGDFREVFIARAGVEHLRDVLCAKLGLPPVAAHDIPTALFRADYVELWRKLGDGGVSEAAYRGG